jgi:hypothetical protein
LEGGWSALWFPLDILRKAVKDGVEYGLKNRDLGNILYSSFPGCRSSSSERGGDETEIREPGSSQRHRIHLAQESMESYGYSKESAG